jgi:hypothetical protein
LREIFRREPDRHIAIVAHGSPLWQSIGFLVPNTPGIQMQVASITRRPNGYAFAHVEGAHRPSVNGVPLVGDSVPLRNGDVIELAGTQMQFIHP